MGLRINIIHSDLASTLKFKKKTKKNLMGLVVNGLNRDNLVGEGGALALRNEGTWDQFFRGIWSTTHGGAKTDN